MPFVAKHLGILAAAFLVTGCGAAAGSSSPSTAPIASHTPSTTNQSSPNGAHSSTIRVTPAMAAQSSMTAIDFPSSHVGWAAGSGQIWKTTHGGTQWSRVYRLGSTNFRGIQFIGPENGWVWSDHLVVGTSNGGRTWSRFYKGTKILVTLSMATAQVGYAVLGNNSQANGLYVTHDAGRQWQHMASPFTPLTTAFFNANIGWAVSQHKVWKTIDGGKKWTPSHTFASPLPVAARIRLAGTNAVWVMLLGGSGMSQTSYTVLSHTVGQGWTVRAAKSTAGAGPAPDANGATPNGPGLAPGPLFAVNPNIAYLAGGVPADGFGTTSIWSTQSQGAAWNPYSSVYGLNGIPGPRSLSFVTPQVGWLVTGAGNTTVFQTVDSGRTWHQIFPPSAAPIQSIAFVNVNLGYGLGAPGQPNAVLVTHDGGKHWSKISTLPTSLTWNMDTARPSMDFTSPQSGWVVRNNQLWHTHDGGAQWSTVTLPHFSSADSLNLVAFIGRDGVVGSPYSHTSWWTTNGGASWHWAQNQNTRQTLATVNTAVNHEANRLGQPLLFAGSHGNVQWIMFENEDWAISSNGGSSWTVHRFPSHILTTIGNLTFVNAQDGWFETGGGSLFATTNGGSSWNPVY